MGVGGGTQEGVLRDILIREGFDAVAVGSSNDWSESGEGLLQAFHCG